MIAVPELMRVLVDEKGFEWDEAWEITQKCFAYTCHTLLPEALEVWSTELLGRLLPRHLEIIYRINDDFLAEVRAAYPDDELRARRMSIIADYPERAVRMAFLATVAGTKVNGVAALHSQLLRRQGAAGLLQLLAGQVHQRHQRRHTATVPADGQPVAVGADHRRPRRRAGSPTWSGWPSSSRTPRTRTSAPRSATPRRRTRPGCTTCCGARDGIDLPDDHLLDVMVKRLHEYKRQSLKLLHIVTLYDQIISGRVDPTTITPRTVVFGAKAAPGYRMAKETIHLINQVGATINADPRVAGRLSVAFPANYNVTLAEKLIPAADLSEQISLAGMEASGTGNMKFALNGALTIGTDDGANVEIRQLVGDDNFFLFGMVEPEVAALQAAGLPADQLLRVRPRPEERDRPDLLRGVLRRRPACVRAGRLQPALRGPVHGAGRLPGLHRRPGGGGGEVRRRRPRGPVRRSSTWPAPGSSPPTAPCATT